MWTLKNISSRLALGKTDRMQPTRQHMSSTGKQPSLGLRSRLRDLGLRRGALLVLFNTIRQNQSTRTFLKMSRTGFRKGRSGLTKATEITGQEISSRAQKLREPSSTAQNPKISIKITGISCI